MFGVYMNYLSVLVAAVVSYLFGWLWHGPLFGKKWMELEGFTKEGMQNSPRMKHMTAIMVGGFISTFIFAWGLAYVLSAAGVVFNLSGALMIAFVIWLAFTATTLAGGWLWEGKSGRLLAFGAVYQLISIVIMTLILVLW